MVDDDVADLVRRAAAGEATAWNALVERFQGLVWSVARAHGLRGHDAGDVSQTTWMRLVEHLDQVRDPARVGSWLATTARRESVAVLRRGGREQPVEIDDYTMPPPPETTSGPEQALLTGERDRLLREALAVVSPRCRRLLRILLADPAPTYAEVGAALEMPVGSIGPTRARCLACLRRRLDHETLEALEFAAGTP